MPGQESPHYAATFAARYDDWFPSPVTDSTVELLAALAKTAGDGPVLELGSGTGRVALPLAARGLDVHGVEGAPEMTERLRAKPGGHDITVTAGDFSSVPVDGSFAMVYVVSGGFFELPTQQSQARCFAAAAARLLPGGLFVLDAHVPEALAAPEAALHVVPIEGGMTVRMRTIDRASQRYSSHYLVLDGNGVHHVPVSFRYASAGELDLMAAMAGLRLRNRYGGWSGEAFTAASAYHVSVYELPVT
ncbi:class I SAM-dependent DNA methyltransferase [Streptomyces spiramenti]|uniref:Class I SAM-dependent methyltransferase n=1 Tax=Streptomyces spiramenti TaxID=2720606 RepID=A0ABX1AIL6_9ACTN|nr:class I SAM-dependent methyltransferase [Streptomyces spiramenti]NJP65761.1 class I SAM-dependent methyltransferase [Streptomyces spiramenti]